ncbi:MAG: zinc-dependent alcohol dehydrogenase [Saccharofermentanales bacterium]
MKAAIKTGKERFEIIDVPMPEIGRKDVLVRIRYCSICAWCYEEWGRDACESYLGPGLTGHEMAGIVEEAGSEVTDWKPGDKVLVYIAKGCGKCAMCRKGEEIHCKDRTNITGGFAEYIAVPENYLLKAPPGIDLKYSVLITDMVGTAMHGIRRAFASSSKAKSVITVWGAGPVGLFVVQGLRCYDDVGKIIVLDPVGSRREMALRLGADEALDPLDDMSIKKLMAENEGYGADFAFCCLNVQNAVDMAYKTLSPDGVMMNINGSIKVDPYEEKLVNTSFYFLRNEYEENVKMVLDGKIVLEPLLSHTYDLGDINAAMEMRSKHPEKSFKINIECNK